MLTKFKVLSDESKKKENREVIKILIRTAHYQIKHMMSNMSYTSLVELISDCGSDILKKFMIRSPKNASYLSLRTFDNLLQVLNKFTEEPLLQSLRKSRFVTLFHDETSDVSNHSEAAVFAMFLHEGEFKEHYLGIMNMSEGQTAEKHYLATLNMCNQKGLDLSKVQFSDLDGCNTNNGDLKGFKLYFLYHNPFHLHHTCNSHTLALIPKHKITDSRYKCIADADSIMVSLHVLLKKSTVRLNVFERCQIVLEMKVLKIVCPSSTRWLTHEFCFRRVLEVFEPVIMALAQLYQDRADVEALGVLIQMIDPQFVLSALMLADMLAVIRPLTLWLQTSPSKADITDLSPAVDLVVNKLKYLASESPELRSKFSEAELINLKFNKEVFSEKLRVISEVVESLPIASCMRTSSQQTTPGEMLEEFKINIYKPFIMEIAEEIDANIRIDPVSAAFKCLDVKYFPSVKADLSNYGLEDMRRLIEHFGEVREESHPKTRRSNRSDPKIDKHETLKEYEIYKMAAFDINCERNKKLKQKLHSLQSKLKTTLTKTYNKSTIDKLKVEITELENKIDRMSLAEIFKALNVPGKKFQF